MWYAVSKNRNKFPKTAKFYYSAVVFKPKITISIVGVVSRIGA